METYSAIISPINALLKDMRLVITPNDRTWKEKYNDKIVVQYNSVMNDDFSSKEFEYCFLLLSTQNIDMWIAENILDTPITKKVEVYYYNTDPIDVGVTFNTFLFKRRGKDKKISTYRDLFNLIGTNCQYNQIKIKKADGSIVEYVKGQRCHGIMFIKYKDGIIYYGYDK